MSTLYFNPTTKVIFESEDAQDAAIQTITADEVPDLIANGATVDSSAAGWGVGNAAPAAEAQDASVTGSDTAADLGNADGSASTAESNTTITEPESKSASDAGTEATTATNLASSSDLGPDAEGTASGEAIAASPAAAESASDTSSSASNASQDAGTPADTLNDSASTAELRTELDAANARIADLEAQLAAITGSDHPIHPILSQIDAELSRPDAIIVVEIKNLVNRARALF